MLLQKVDFFIAECRRANDRKNDGFGIAEDYPRLKKAASAVYDMFPHAVTGMTNEDLARGTRKVLDHVREILPDAVDLMGPGGLRKVAGDALADMVIEDMVGGSGKEIARTVLDPVNSVAGRAADRIMVALSVAVEASVYHIARKLEDWDNRRMAEIHARHGIPIMRGSDLHKAYGDPRIHVVMDAEPAPEPLQMRDFNPFGNPSP